MIKKIVSIFFISVVFTLFLTCNTYQIGGSYAVKEGASSYGVSLGGDFIEYLESSLYMYANINETFDILGFGYEIGLKYPFYLGKNRIGIFPMATFETQYLNPFSNGQWGLGIKFGGGLELNLSPSLFIRGTFLYQPEFTTFLDGNPGYNINASLGFRTKDDPVRRKLTQARNERQRTQSEQARRQEANRSEQDKVRALQRAISSNPNSAKAHYDMGMYHVSNRDNVLAAASMARALELDPAYRHTGRSHYTPSNAATFGIQTTSNFSFEDYSLNYYLACMYFDAANGTGTDPNKFVPAAEKQSTLEKTLATYRRGYEIDITGGKNNNRNLRAVYLGFIAKTLDLMGRRDEASSMYVELSRTTTVTDDIAFRAASASRGQSFFVSARGNDNNDGLSEATALRSLSLAYEKATAGRIKVITVIGTLNHQSEGEKTSDTAVFDFSGTSNNEILITGKWGATRAVLSGAGSRKNVVSILLGAVRFEYIEISGGELNSENKNGDGILNMNGELKIGQGAVIRGNKGTGIVNLLGDLTLAGGDIRDNENRGVNNSGTFVMQSGTIRNNKSTESGGGVMNFMLSNCSFTMSGGTISNNTAAKDGGGVFTRNNFTMSGGTISNNTATEDGGGVSFGNNFIDAVFTMSGGSITNNRARYGGGVYIVGISDERKEEVGNKIFRQSGGSITGNSARTVGGVFVGRNSSYNRTGGTVTNNTATHHFTDRLSGSNDNVTRMPGSSGSGN
ncbi:MAG: hypothetical protein FWD26_03070 [Treponema sp.]|nr:hypothetical protein [Treponema sp.]